MTSTTPVIYLIFNRPDLTERSFEAVRQAKPPKLYVVADGPRPDKAGEAELCRAARAITERIDWPCEVTRDYSATNLGCGRRVSSGITNAFQLYEEAIILEDDCLPHPSFFNYCAELLTRYRDDDRVMCISGDNLQPRRRTPNSYYFSKYATIWGWATWRRAWQHYDFTMAGWPEIRWRRELAKRLPKRAEYEHWERTFESIHRGEVDTWDIQWMYATWIRGAWSAIPEVNLVTNLGFREDATHTKTGELSSRLVRPVEEIGEIVHPDSITPNEDADAYLFETIFNAAGESKWQRAKRWLKSRI